MSSYSKGEKIAIWSKKLNISNSSLNNLISDLQKNGPETFCSNLKAKRPEQKGQSKNLKAIKSPNLKASSSKKDVNMCALSQHPNDQ